MTILAGIFIIVISCAILLMVIIEIYYKIRKEDQISSPYIHINCILLSVVIGVCYIIEIFIRTSKSPDPPAWLAPYLLAFPILGCCIIAGILVGFFYMARGYKLLLGKKTLRQAGQ
jgi:hypothetical protein